MKPIYQEYRPSSALEKIIDTYWYNAFDEHQESYCELQHYLPNGMAELIIHLDQNRSECLLQGQWMPFPETCFTGIIEEPVFWRMRGKTALFGIRFKPESILQLFGLKVRELSNTFIDTEIFKNEHITSIIKQTQQAPDNPTRIFLIETLILSQASNIYKVNDYFSTALNLIRNTHPVYSVDELSRAVCISERQLQRVFKGYLGIGPKSYIQIIRFHRVYQILQNRPNISWHDLAFDFGYSDQAHFIRDFKVFSGKTPREIVRN